MDNNVHFGDGVLDEAKVDINSRAKGLVKIVIDAVFDYLEGKVKDFPETIERLRNSPETEQRIVALWSEHLFEEGLVAKGYNGLSDNLLISNFHQEGYLDGLYVGYVLAMMALADNDAPKDIILAARDYIRSPTKKQTHILT
ncbi:MAG TPA: hypothetical protein DIW07_11150 [Lachnospiraceae bacterium]|uniref:hypothetical protein n=1 Tax=Muricomes intestini TaxID=1796634 RepID=UPI000ED3E9A2|nr:hypothetical protein [Lachnospiraceae bacterium]